MNNEFLFRNCHVNNRVKSYFVSDLSLEGLGQNKRVRGSSLSPFLLCRAEGAATRRLVLLSTVTLFTLFFLLVFFRLFFTSCTFVKGFFNEGANIVATILKAKSTSPFFGYHF